jgi:hypothetical protein
VHEVDHLARDRDRQISRQIVPQPVCGHAAPNEIDALKRKVYSAELHPGPEAAPINAARAMHEYVGE